MLNKLEKYTTSIFSETHRPKLIMVVGITIFVSIATLIYLFLTTEPDTAQGTFSIETNADQATIDPNLTNAQKAAIKERDKARYNEAASTPNGVQIPFVGSPNRKPISELNNVETCGCTISDEQFALMLQRAGVLTENANTVIERIGESDVFLSSAGFLVSDTGNKHRFNGQSVKLGENGILLDEQGMPISMPPYGDVFLSTKGILIDGQTRPIETRGSFLSSDGVVILGSGQYAYRRGNNSQIAETDTYVTEERQLITVDGKPVRHAGNFVYKNTERELINKLDVPLRWQDEKVLQNRSGHLVNSAGTTFTTPGILFSYDGTMIDNFGRLTAPLMNLQQVGESDIYLDDNGVLRDRYSGDLSHYGAALTVGVNDQLYGRYGLAYNHNNSSVKLVSNGSLQTEIGTGGVRSGWIKDSTGVAYDRFGVLISRPGKLTPRGQSSIYLTSDGLLADRMGKPMQYEDKDLLLDFDAYLPSNLIGLMTYDGVPALDIYGQRLYLSEQGTFVTNENVPAAIGVKITTTDDVVIRNDGVIADDSSLPEQLVTNDGKAVYYKGRLAYRDSKGQLLDDNFQPILNENGEPLFLNENGFITKENGQIINTKDFTTLDASEIENGVFSTLKPMLDNNGRQLLVNGKPVFRRGSQLVFADGVQVRDDSGSALSVTKDGTVVNESGGIDETLTEQLQNVSPSADLVSVAGKPIFYKGKTVYRRADDALVDAQGKLITTPSGEVVYLRDNGRLETKSGGEVSPSIFQDTQGVAVNDEAKLDSGALSDVLSGGKPTYIDGKKVYRRNDGTLVDENNMPFRDANNKAYIMDSNGVIRNEDGRLISTPLLKSKTGRALPPAQIDKPKTSPRALSKNGKPVYFNGKRVFQNADGTLADENGDIVTDKNGSALALDSAGNLINNKGEPVVESLFTDREGKSIQSSAFSTQAFQPVPAAVNGKPVFINGKRVFKRNDGTLVDANDNVIHDKKGRALKVDSDGNVLTSDGQKADVELVDNTGNAHLKLDKSTPTGDSAVKANGKQLFHNGKPVFKRMDGMLVDRDGNAIRDANGKRLKMDALGNVLNEDGSPVGDIFTDENGRTVSNSSIDPGFRLDELTKNGKSLLFNGKKVYRRPDGALVDESNNIVTTRDGRAVYINDKGELVDQNDQLITSALLTDQDGNSVANSGLDLPSSLREAVQINGKPLKYFSKDVFRLPSGQLVDQNNRAILDESGKPVFLNDRNELVDGQNKKVAVSGLETTDRLTNGQFSTRKSLSSGGLQNVTPEGFLLDEKGKAITYNGKPVIVGPDGMLITEDGQPVTTRDGRRVKMNANGEVVTEDNKKLTESLLKNGDGVALYSDGRPVTSNIRRIGDSDLFLTQDGRVVDETGKAVKINGKDAFIDTQTGALVDSDGETLRDAMGSSLYLTDSGVIADRQLNQAPFVEITSSDGRVIDSSGNMASNESLTRIPNTDYYTTQDGLVTDENGKAILINGEPAYVDDQNRIRNALGRELRFRGQRIAINETGEIIGSNGDVLTDENGQPVDLNIISARTDSDAGTLTNQPTGNQRRPVTSNQAAVTPIDRPTATAGVNATSPIIPDVDTTTNPTKQQLESEESEATTSSNPSADTNSSPAKTEKIFKLADLTVPSKMRLASRYNDLLLQMEKEYSDIKTSAVSTAAVKTTSLYYPKPAELAPTADAKALQADVDALALEPSSIAAYAGDTFYGYTEAQFNSDLNPELEVRIVGENPKHPLNNAVAYAVPSIRYDNAVFLFTRICPANDKCKPMNGIALDLNTASAAISADVDEHFWYRHGGLFLASFGKELSDAITLTGERTESATLNGSRTVTTGIDTNDAFLKAAAGTGGAFLPSLAERYNRPPTVNVPYRAEIAIRILDTLEL